MVSESHSVLVIDDDKRLTSLILDLLKLNGLDVTGVHSAAEAWTALASRAFDVLVVDWVMPRESGIEFVSHLKRSGTKIGEIPIIMLTALSDTDNKLVGFENGVDDYVTKPFEGKELVARIKSVVRRCKVRNPTRDVILRFGKCEFHPEAGKIFYNSQEMALTAGELMLLRALCMKPNQPCSREELSKKLGFTVADRTIDVQITRLRKKIGDDTRNPSIIRTMRHVGYSIAGHPDYPEDS
jgi:two-component system phosphate regulon response regulator OmpR